MLTRFEVKNFQGFNHLIYDFNTDKRYDFNTNIIKDKIVNSSLIFGKNNSGKTALTLALIDITNGINVSLKNGFPNWHYINAYAKKEEVFFKYDFNFDGDKVEYEYTKSAQYSFIYEKLLVNNKLILYRNVIDPSLDVIKIKNLGTLNISSCSSMISIIKFISSYNSFDKESVIYKLINYVNKILWVTFGQNCLYNDNLPFDKSFEEKKLLEGDNLSNLQEFLNTCGINYNLVPLNLYGKADIGVKFGDDKILPLLNIASSGTIDLIIYFYFSTLFNDMSLIILDEFDSTFEYNISKKIYKDISSLSNTQSILTTHNLLLLDNEYTRPDCIFYLNNNQIKPLSSLIHGSIRKNNNLLKMYLDGKFNTNF